MQVHVKCLSLARRQQRLAQTTTLWRGAVKPHCTMGRQSCSLLWHESSGQLGLADQPLYATANALTAHRHGYTPCTTQGAGQQRVSEAAMVCKATVDHSASTGLTARGTDHQGDSTEFTLHKTCGVQQRRTRPHRQHQSHHHSVTPSQRHSVSTPCEAR